MRWPRGTSVDPLAAGSALLSAAMAGGYVAVMHHQGDSPLVWAIMVLVAGALLAGYGAWRPAPHRRPALVAAGIGLILLGLLAILTIGVPIVAAGMMALASGARDQRRPRE